jgi:hypothetical protein
MLVFSSVTTSFAASYVMLFSICLLESICDAEFQMLCWHNCQALLALKSFGRGDFSRVFQEAHLGLFS